MKIPLPLHTNKQQRGPKDPFRNESPFGDFVWVRIDCDHPFLTKPIMLSWLNFFCLIFPSLRIPHQDRLIKTVKDLLSNFRIPRMWFFRRATCPDSWDEPFGLHLDSNNPSIVAKDYDFVAKRLGKPKCFTRHGFSRVASGVVWSSRDVKRVCTIFNLVDYTFCCPEYVVSRTKRFDPEIQKVIIMHPYLLFSHQTEFLSVLRIAVEYNKGK